MGLRKIPRTRPRIPTFVICILFAVPIIGFLYWYFSFTAPNLPQPPLKELAANHNVKLGSLLSLSRLENEPYQKIMTSQFSFVTSDEEVHWVHFRPSPTKFNFDKLDNLIAFAKANDMPVQVHHLVWGEKDSLPKWLRDGHYSKAQLTDILHDDITSTVSHYKGQVAEWSVVNEAFSRGQHNYGLHDWWADNLGSGTKYIDDSFIWAQQADPKAKLILNDAENETENSISDAMFNYIKDAKARGIPIDGIGMQMHINATRPPSKEDVIKNIQRFGAIGVPTYITEFDVNVNTVKGSSAYKNQLESQITYNMVRACIEAKTCVSFNEFGITDKQNWLKWLGHTNSRSYLFDSRYRPKPSFYGFRDAWNQP